jgi:serine/threonine-protein kinase
VYDWSRDTLTRVSFGGTENGFPVWTPDGKRIAFASNRDGRVTNLYWQRADTGDVQRLTVSTKAQYPGSWHPNGHLLAFDTQSAPGLGGDIMILPIEGDNASGWKPGEPQAFLATPQGENYPVFSPDGKWIAYQSDESNRREVYVRPYPGPGGQWQISTAGGGYPSWSRTRTELLYSVNGSIMVVPYSVDGNSFRPESPRLWATGRYVSNRGNNRVWDLHPDGNRFVAAPPAEADEAKRDTVVLVSDFFKDVSRTAPATQR